MRDGCRTEPPEPIWTLTLALGQEITDATAHLTGFDADLFPDEETCGAYVGLVGHGVGFALARPRLGAVSLSTTDREQEVVVLLGFSGMLAGDVLEARDPRLFARTLEA